MTDEQVSRFLINLGYSIHDINMMLSQYTGTRWLAEDAALWQDEIEEFIFNRDYAVKETK